MQDLNFEDQVLGPKMIPEHTWMRAVERIVFQNLQVHYHCTRQFIRVREKVFLVVPWGCPNPNGSQKFF